MSFFKQESKDDQTVMADEKAEAYALITELFGENCDKKMAAHAVGSILSTCEFDMKKATDAIEKGKVACAFAKELRGMKLPEELVQTLILMPFIYGDECEAYIAKLMGKDAPKEG